MSSGESYVNRRAGHVAVSYRQGALVWGGYLENQDYPDQYWTSSQVWLYNSLTHTWRCQKTAGDIPSKCSGAAAAVVGDTMYVLAGFHKVVVSMKALRAGENNGAPSLTDSDTDEEDEEDSGQMVNSVEISNSIWSLDLNTWLWTKLEPGGEPPLKCDKTAAWTAGDKVFLFGGFGPPPGASMMDKVGSLFDFCEDPSSSTGGYIRGWSNQLVCYNTTTNCWEWPLSSGRPPSPRAAHSVTTVNNTAYVFGGRHMDTRLNDLYSLDLLNMRWSLILSDSNADDVPVGRSWQTMTALTTGRREGGLLMYGGFDNNYSALGDCWRMDLSQQPHSWLRCPHLEQGPRLWHAAVDLDPSSVIIIGGLTNNILAPLHVSKHHAEKVLCLRVAPPSLLKLCLEFITNNKEMFHKEVDELPQSLRKIVQIRCSSGA